MDDQPVQRIRRFGLLVSGVGVTLMLMGVMFSPSANGAARSSAMSANSNNGDVKVQDAGDPNFPPENDPHVDCPFDLVFYNFDAAQQLTATLEGQPPSGDGELVWGPTVVVTDPDGFARIHIAAGTLNLAGLGSHPEGGANDLDDKHTGARDGDEPTYHLKLDVQTLAGQHLFKHKVFWVGECATGPATATTASTTSTTSTTIESVGPATSSTSTSSTTSVTVASGPSATVAGQSASRGTSTVLGAAQAAPTSTAPSGTASVSATSNRSLPFTGGGAVLLLFGVALTVSGLVFAQAARRRAKT
jgi:hypothetical protein